MKLSVVVRSLTVRRVSCRVVWSGLAVLAAAGEGVFAYVTLKDGHQEDEADTLLAALKAQVR